MEAVGLTIANGIVASFFTGDHDVGQNDLLLLPLLRSSFHFPISVQHGQEAVPGVSIVESVCLVQANGRKTHRLRSFDSKSR
jgi:hypothetical protein